MVKPASSASGVEGIGPMAVLLSLLPAACLAVHLGSVLRIVVGEGVIAGGAVGFAIAAILAALSTSREQEQTRLGLGLGLSVAAPAVMVLAGVGPFAIGWLALGGVAASLAMPLVQWCCDTQPLPRHALATDVAARSSHPIPGAVVAGILLFSMPVPSPYAPFLAAGFFGSLLMIGSLGGMLLKSRLVGRTATVDGQALARWLFAALLMLLIVGTVGISTPVVAKLRERNFEESAAGRGIRPLPGSLGGRFGERPDGSGSETSPAPNPSDTGPNSPRPNPSDQGDPSRPQNAPPQTPEDYRNLAIKALVLAAFAAALFWLAKRYGAVIARAANRLWAFLAGPFLRWAEARRSRAAEAVREAAIAVEMDRQGDPFEPLPEAPDVAGLGRVYQVLLAAAHLAGVDARPGETVALFAVRLGRETGLDRGLLQTVCQVCARGVYAPSPPSESERRAAAAAATTLLRKVQSQFPDKTLAERQHGYRRKLAAEALEPA